MFTRLLLAGVLAFVGTAGITSVGGTAAGAADARPEPETFEFALIGDVPYSDFEVTNSFPNLIEEVNQAPLAFVIHDGDIKSGSTACTAELFRSRYAQFQTLAHPLIYIPGDNEWTDCGRVKTNSLAPEAALDLLREIFCQGSESLGQRQLPLVRQSEAQPEHRAYRENVRWAYGGVMFAGLNLPGSGNNFGRSEFAARQAANLAWLRDSFAVAHREKSRALMLIIQANPRFDLAATNQLRAGFNEWLAALERETIAFDRPVVLVHGDSHYFRIDKPLVSSRSGRRIEHFTRVETFGHPDAHWVRVRVDARDPEVFSFHPQIVAKNRLRHDP
ncbi:MAG TPA: hypothetical protein VNO52_17115 [Methylomirabilota bacterium]|nr:hypothetical protein [Methylomirabilota bacterium]